LVKSFGKSLAPDEFNFEVEEIEKERGKQALTHLFIPKVKVKSPKCCLAFALMN
jgi:hypothetical protein